MNTPDPPIGQHDLHAFVDGQLEPERMLAVLAHLQAHPDQARQVAAWQAQRRALRQWHRRLDPGPTPAAMEATLRAHAAPSAPSTARRASAGHWQQAAVVAGSVLLGAAMAHWWPGAGTAAGLAAGSARPDAGLAEAAPEFVRDAGIADAVFRPEKRHAVEVPASEHAHLMQWLSRRLGVTLRTPDLGAEGYRLLGGRLLPGEPTPRAQFMYEDAGGRRVTLFVTVFGPDDAPDAVGFRTHRDEERAIYYWIDGRFGYALSVPASGDTMALAKAVHRQLAVR